MPPPPEEIDSKVDHRSTLNLPSTAFPMRGNLPKREPERLAAWDESGLYRKILDRRKDAPLWILHDGPPYANGNIHIGHTLNKVLKDFIVKFRSMSGNRVPYVPGWDCHGLPIELQVEKNLGGRREGTKADFRQHCREYADRFVSIQREEFRRLGILGDWQRPYLTMDPHYEATEVRALGTLFDRGAVYRGRKPVLWCASCQTALAEAEVDYQDHTSPSVYVRFPLTGDLPGPLAPFAGEGPAFVIWTTTPWTLPANLAICLHPDLDYVLLASGDDRFVVAEGLVEPFLEAIRRSDFEILARCRGAELEGATARHPWIDREAVVVLGDHVTLEAGTGCVHTAPGHGQEDYEVGRRYDLDVYAPVDGEGRFTKDVEGFAGELVFDADTRIVALLRENGSLVAAENYAHSYPHCWRCKSPVLFRATDQWFVSLETGDLRARALEEIDRVRWIPRWGRERIRGMMESRPDWCISRQRSWGVPIVALHCQDCGETVATKEIADQVADVFEEHGSDVWYVYPLSQLIPAGTKCPGCGGGDFRKEEDILDVWFDSGLSHLAVLDERDELRWPADLYLEGSDQHRGWFHTSLLTAILTHGKAPYEAVLTHGFTVDAGGRKMSKSLGNDIKPQEILKTYGAEILRLWVAAEDYRGDVRISDEIIGRMVESYRRIRNTARFLLANLADFDPESDAVEPTSELDRWILDRTDRLVERCRAAFDEYEFHVVFHALNNFCSVDLSSLYLDVTKDTLYCSRADDPGRRAIQTAMLEILDRLVRVMAPVLSFTADEIWENAPGRRAESVFLADFPEPAPDRRDDALAERWEKFLELRSEVTRAIEAERKAGNLGHSLEAAVRLRLPRNHDAAAVAEALRDELELLFIVSSVELEPAEDGAAPSIEVSRAPGTKCARCWMYRTSIGENAATPDLCARCAAVVADG